MSTITLNWYPPTPPGVSLSDELKVILARRYFDTDGSFSATLILTSADVAFLEGLVFGGQPGATAILTAISDFGSVILRWE